MLRIDPTYSVANDRHSMVSGEETIIGALRARAQNLVESIAENDSLTEDQVDDWCCQLLDDLNQIASEMACLNANTIMDVVGKIFVWKALADEALLNSDDGPADERLLLSILRDVERINRVE